MAYKHIFFDLDRTLWDFEANSREAFRDIFMEFDLFRFFPSEEAFVLAYDKYNEELWEQYRKGKIKKDFLRHHRFKLTLLDFDVRDDMLAKKIGERYLEVAPSKTNLIPHTDSMLAYLFSRYDLHIITNGFSEVQIVKIQSSGLEAYFKTIVTSDGAGYQKPNPKIFEHALKNINAKKAESIMIGDDLEVDILGARKFGMDQVFYNPKKNVHQEKVTYEIASLSEIKSLF